jgi:hypothetical protein
MGAGGPPKRRYPTTPLRGAATQKIKNSIFTAVETSNASNSFPNSRTFASCLNVVSFGILSEQGDNGVVSWKAVH